MISIKVPDFVVYTMGTVVFFADREINYQLETRDLLLVYFSG